MYQPHQLGRWGEGKAEEYLKSKGYKVIEKNFKRKWGELDIVAFKKKVFVFVEVKTIKKPDPEEPFFPEDELNEKKAYQLRKMVQLYFDFKKISPETACQIDIIAIEKQGQGEKDFNLRHYENAFEDSF
ncbi:YraN family protein [Candidatus Parcubacteria bacterium]|nr:YraN family protein [Candidatus Parcubacteria bacterium]